MAEKLKEKTLSYRRAIYFGKENELKPLQSYLEEAHTALTKISQRSIKLPDDAIIECRNCDAQARGIFLHLAAYNPGEQASIVPKITDATNGDISTTPPPLSILSSWTATSWLW